MALQPRAAFDPEWLFAQPAQQPTAARFRQRRPGASVVTALAFSLIAVAVIASYAAPGHGTGRHQGDLHADGKTGAASSKAGNGPRRVVDSGRQPLSYYAREVRPGMFSAPVQALHRPEPLVIKTAPLPVVPPMPVNPFADWAYKGTIRSGSRIIALLENTKTHEGQFVQQGDQFMGSMVKSVSDEMVSLSSEGKPYLMAKSDTVTVTQLDKNAPFLGGAAPAAAPSTPAGPAVPAPPPPAQTAPVVSRPVIQDQSGRLSGTQWFAGPGRAYVVPK